MHLVEHTPSKPARTPQGHGVLGCTVQQDKTWLVFDTQDNILSTAEVLLLHNGQPTTPLTLSRTHHTCSVVVYNPGSLRSLWLAAGPLLRLAAAAGPQQLLLPLLLAAPTYPQLAGCPALLLPAAWPVLLQASVALSV
jgi:hypothetical protein